MKKVNKILMATIAILLSLVLISTSVVSGIFARYVVDNKATAKIKFKKFGVEVGLTIDGDLLTALGGAQKIAEYTTTDGKSISINIPNNTLTMEPGSDFRDDIQVSITGTANTRLKVNIDFSVSYSDAIFEIPPPVGGLVTHPKMAVPIGFTLGCNGADGTYTSKDADQLKPWHYISALHADSLYADYFVKNVNMIKRGGLSSSTNSSVEKIFELNDTIVFHPMSSGAEVKNVNINDFYIGWHWPFEHNVVDGVCTVCQVGDCVATEDREAIDYDAIDAWISYKNPTMAFSLIVTVEQVDSNYTIA